VGIIEDEGKKKESAKSAQMADGSCLVDAICLCRERDLKMFAANDVAAAKLSSCGGDAQLLQ
jgi:hypothetical protein